MKNHQLRLGAITCIDIGGIASAGNRLDANRLDR